MVGDSFCGIRGTDVQPSRHDRESGDGRNPVISLAEGNIDQHKGQQTTAGAYPNPSVTAYGGHGELRDVGRAGIGPFLDRTSLTEYNVVVGQPVEWPAMRAARQQVADLWGGDRQRRHVGDSIEFGVSSEGVLL